MSDESVAIDSLRVSLESQLSTMRASIDDLVTTTTNLVTATGEIDTSISAMSGDLTRIADSVEELATTFGELGSNNSIVSNVETQTQLATEIQQDIATLTTALGTMTSQSYFQNIEDLRNDIRDSLVLSLDALKRSGAPTLGIKREDSGA